MAAAAAAPPATASDPPSQKSFWTSTTINPRTASTVREPARAPTAGPRRSLAAPPSGRGDAGVHPDVGGGAAGDLDQLGERGREHRVDVTGRRPDLAVAFQPGVHQRAQRR